MKFIIKLSISLFALIIFGCGKTKFARLAPETLYDVNNLKVVKSIINNKKGTISVLYGNDPALKMAMDPMQQVRAGAEFTLVSWNQKPMPQWYGTNMNKDIYSVETVKVLRRNAQALTFDYEFQTGPGIKPGDLRADKDKRIGFIITQQAAVFP